MALSYVFGAGHDRGNQSVEIVSGAHPSALSTPRYFDRQFVPLFPVTLVGLSPFLINPRGPQGGHGCLLNEKM